MFNNILKFVSITSISIFALTSCEKKACYDCATERTITIIPDNIIISQSTSTTVVCDETKEGIKIVEQNGTKYNTFWKDEKLHQQSTITTCKPY